MKATSQAGALPVANQEISPDPDLLCDPSTRATRRPESRAAASSVTPLGAGAARETEETLGKARCNDSGRGTLWAAPSRGEPAHARKRRRSKAARYPAQMRALTFLLAALAASACSPAPDAPTCARWARLASAEDRVCYDQTRKDIVRSCLDLQVELRTTRCLEGECSPLSKCPGLERLLP